MGRIATAAISSGLRLTVDCSAEHGLSLNIRGCCWTSDIEGSRIR
jgi:hypothetical protein